MLHSRSLLRPANIVEPNSLKNASTLGVQTKFLANERLRHRFFWLINSLETFEQHSVFSAPVLRKLPSTSQCQLFEMILSSMHFLAHDKFWAREAVHTIIVCFRNTFHVVGFKNFKIV